MTEQEERQYQRMKRCFKEIMAYTQKHNREAFKYMSPETLYLWEQLQLDEHPYFNGIPMP